jgi:hypothetical protein
MVANTFHQRCTSYLNVNPGRHDEVEEVFFALDLLHVLNNNFLINRLNFYQTIPASLQQLPLSIANLEKIL